MGISYFYKFEDKSNKRNSKGYFEIAKTSETLEEKKKVRASRLFVISNYYSKIGIVDEAGDVSISYKDYWNDLTKASEGNLVKEDNARTAVVMYEEFISQILTKTLEFRNTGVSKEEMLKQIESIEEHVKFDFANLDERIRETVDEELQMLCENLKRAKKMVGSVYEQVQ